MKRTSWVLRRSPCWRPGRRRLCWPWRRTSRPPTALPSTARCWRTATRPTCSKPRAKTSGNRSAGRRTRRWKSATWARGPGVVKGAFVELPRYFPDTQRVQDLESRMSPAWKRCRASTRRAIAKTNRSAAARWPMSRRWPPGSRRCPRACASTCRKATPKSAASTKLGKRAFFFRGGPHDFSCAACHGQDNKRIRLQDLPNLTKNPGDGVGFAAWPAYRVSNGQMWTHAIAAERLLPPAAIPVPRLRLGRDHRARHATWASTPRVSRSPCPPSSAEGGKHP